MSCVAARAVARTAAVPAVARRVCGSHARMTGASLRAMRAPQGAVWRTLATAAPDASVGGDADGEPVDYTALIPDNLHLHNPQDALPTSERALRPRVVSCDHCWRAVSLAGLAARCAIVVLRACGVCEHWRPTCCACLAIRRHALCC